VMEGMEERDRPAGEAETVVAAWSVRWEWRKEGGRRGPGRSPPGFKERAHRDSVPQSQSQTAGQVVPRWSTGSFHVIAGLRQRAEREFTVGPTAVY
jgi:hypothetical protein